jgi:glycerol-3-phosphate dehydrogenase
MIYNGDPDQLKATEKEIQDFLDEINQAYPKAELEMEDVFFVHVGLLPSLGVCKRTGSIQLSKQYQICDHQEEGANGLISVVGVKYTTARHVAEKAVDLVFGKLGKRPPNSATAVTPLHGGQIEQFDAFLTREIRRRPDGLSAEDIPHLVYNYGSAYQHVLKYLDADPGSAQRITGTSSLIKAEVLYGIREEMAQKLADIIFRRTELGSAGYPGDESINACALAMAREFGWDEGRVQREIIEVREAFPSAASASRFAGIQSYQ